MGTNKNYLEFEDDYPINSKMGKKKSQRNNEKMRDLKRNEERKRKLRYC